MSGAEAILVMGVISSIISIIDGTKKVIDAAKDAKGLPKAFREVAERLPIVTNILGSAKQHIESGDVNEEMCKGVKDVVEACEKKVKNLDRLFRQAIPAEGASRLETYSLAARTIGKGRKLEILMKGILEDVQLLTSEHDSQLLWLSGGPGKGKTMLSIFLAGELERNAKDSPDTIFLQYFCDNKDDKRNTATTIIRGLLFQLLQLQPNLFDHILPIFKIQERSLFTDSSFQTLWRIFTTMLHDPSLGPIYCILDGLDECDEASLEVLLTKLKALFSVKTTSSHRLKMIVVSRDLPKLIPELLTGVARIRLDPDADSEVNDDIQQFITERVEHLPAYALCPEPVRLRVKNILRERAQGTFLWVSLVTKALRNCAATEIEKVLEQFPPGLDELYARMLLQIDVNQRELAAKILLWVVIAVRPLTLAELGTAVEISTKSSNEFSFTEVVRDQISHCRSFITIEADEVRLIHQSAKDYLLRDTPDKNSELEAFRIKKENGNLEVARRCMDYLHNGALEGGAVNLRGDIAHLNTFPLLSYAVIHWPEHARSLSHAADIFDLSRPFYQKKSKVREAWFRTIWITEDRYRKVPHWFPLLHLASYFGILPLAKALLREKGWNRIKRLYSINKIDGEKRMALVWAAEGGHEAIVRLLLEKGANIEARDNDGITALSWAAGRGHEAIVQLLLEKGADTNTKGNRGTTALSWAAGRGHEAIVRLLLEKGADINMKGNRGTTALIWAAETGYEATMRLLVEKGADIEAKDTISGGAVLSWAAMGGHKAIVQLLVEKGADVEARDNNGKTALALASERRYKTVVQFLTSITNS